MPAETKLFRCLNDNYGVLIHDPKIEATAGIEAPDAEELLAALHETGWERNRMARDTVHSGVHANKKFDVARTGTPRE